MAGCCHVELISEVVEIDDAEEQGSTRDDHLREKKGLEYGKRLIWPSGDRS